MSEPLFSFEWNQLEDPPRELDEGLLTLIARSRSGELHAVGTGFVIKALPTSALVVSAAHVFAEVQRLQHRGTQTHRTALPEFIPAAKAIELELRSLATLTLKEERVVISAVAGLAFDEDGDFGIAQIKPQKGQEGEFPLREFLLDDRKPQVGQLVCVASYSNLSCYTDETDAFRVTRRLVVRVGRVLEVFPNGHRLCRGPCFETSIPVYSGMSGSPVFWYDKNRPPAAIGIVCSDPDPDGPEKDDRATAGRSLIASLPVRRMEGSLAAQQEMEISFTPSGGSGTFAAKKGEAVQLLRGAL